MSSPSCLTARRCASAGAAPCTKGFARKDPNASKAPGGAKRAAPRATISASRTRRGCASGSFARGFTATCRPHAGFSTGCMRDMPRYFEFAVASNFSFRRGACHSEELMLQAAHIGLDGLGLCDRNSVAGVVRAHLIKREQELALAYHPGARLVFADGTPDILAYPRDLDAWGRLCRLLTRGNLRAEKGQCILYRGDLLEHIEGLELIAMETSTWELASPPVLRKPPSAPASFPLPAPPRRKPSQRPGFGWSQVRRKKRTQAISSHSCATPPAAACGSPPTCSIAAMTTRGSSGAPRSHAKRACRSSLSTTCSITTPI